MQKLGSFAGCILGSVIGSVSRSFEVVRGCSKGERTPCRGSFTQTIYSDLLIPKIIPLDAFKMLLFLLALEIAAVIATNTAGDPTDITNWPPCAVSTQNHKPHTQDPNSHHIHSKIASLSDSQLLPVVVSPIALASVKTHSSVSQ